MTKKPGLDIEFGFYYDYGGAGETRYSLGTREDIEGNTAWIADDLSSIAGGHLSDLKAFYKISTYDDLVGSRGMTSTQLTPSGKARVEGHLLDVIADCELIERGTESHALQS